MTTPELKPCPFCAGTSFDDYDEEHGGKEIRMLHCHGCDASAPLRQWNTRQAAEQAEELERVKSAPTVANTKRANIACPNCQQRIDFELKDAGAQPQPTLTREGLAKLLFDKDTDGLVAWGYANTMQRGRYSFLAGCLADALIEAGVQVKE